jgi:hypothetical protein
VGKSRVRAHLARLPPRRWSSVGGTVAALCVATLGALALCGAGCQGSGGGKSGDAAMCMWTAPRPAASPCGGPACGTRDCQSGVCGNQAGQTGPYQVCCQSDVPQTLGAPCVCDSDCAPETPSDLADLGNAIECSFGKCSCKPGAVSASCPGGDAGVVVDDAGADAVDGEGDASGGDAGAGWCCCDFPPPPGDSCQCVYVTYDVADFCTSSFCNVASPTNSNSVVTACSEPCCYLDQTPGSQTIGSCLCVDQATISASGMTSCADYAHDCIASQCSSPDNMVVGSCPLAGAPP